MKRTGVWLDKAKAHVVTFCDGTVGFDTIPSHVENYHVKGGSGARLKVGPQDVVQDSKYLEREKLQLKKYFNTVFSEIKNVDAIVIFGPAETADKFYKELTAKHKDLSAKTSGVFKTDSMSKNQVKAWAKNHYNIK